METSKMRPVLEAFGQRVRDAREAKGISQEALAELAGLHRTYIGTVERGERNPALINIVRIAEALKIDVGSLTRGLVVDGPASRLRKGMRS